MVSLQNQPIASLRHSFDQIVDDLLCVRPAITQITDMNGRRLGDVMRRHIGFDQRMRCAEFVEMPMDITDSIDHGGVILSFAVGIQPSDGPFSLKNRDVSVRAVRKGRYGPILPSTRRRVPSDHLRLSAPSDDLPS